VTPGPDDELSFGKGGHAQDDVKYRGPDDRWHSDRREGESGKPAMSCPDEGEWSRLSMEWKVAQRSIGIRDDKVVMGPKRAFGGVKNRGNAAGRSLFREGG